MKLSDLRPCDNCGGPLKLGIFYVVRASLAIVRPQAANQVLGLAQVFQGSLGLAEVMAPEADCVKIAGYDEPCLWNEIIVCQDCFMSDLNVAAISEKVNNRNAKEESSDK